MFLIVEGNCTNKCSGNGVCYSGICRCQMGWTGEDCSQCKPKLSSNYAAFCPNNCSNNGYCSSDRCQCNFGWIGNDCSICNDTICGSTYIQCAAQKPANNSISNDNWPFHPQFN